MGSPGGQGRLPAHLALHSHGLGSRLHAPCLRGPHRCCRAAGDSGRPQSLANNGAPASRCAGVAAALTVTGPLLTPPFSPDSSPPAPTAVLPDRAESASSLTRPAPTNAAQSVMGTSTCLDTRTAHVAQQGGLGGPPGTRRQAGAALVLHLPSARGHGHTLQPPPVYGVSKRQLTVLLAGEFTGVSFLLCTFFQKNG